MTGSVRAPRSARVALLLDSLASAPPHAGPALCLGPGASNALPLPLALPSSRPQLRHHSADASPDTSDLEDSSSCSPAVHLAAPLHGCCLEVPVRHSLNNVKTMSRKLFAGLSQVDGGSKAASAKSSVARLLTACCLASPAALEKLFNLSCLFSQRDAWFLLYK